jgi:ubiquitin-conjugating enzyme E2 variant
MPIGDTTQPAHYELTRSQFLFSIISIAAAFLLLSVLGFRIAMQANLWLWWVPLMLLGGVATADFGSGLVHWGADTWGRDDLPIIGYRLLVPFRVHHLNPDDFLRRRFVDTNGDVAFIAVPVLLGLLTVPLQTTWGGAAAIFGFGFCGIGMLTNQIHQWAHMPSPRRPIRILQDCGIILGREEHSTHHERPYNARYCITTGWCNRPLEAVSFFRHLEMAVTYVTGARPREDDQRYEARFG